MSAPAFMDGARAAFASGNAKKSRLLHDAKAAQPDRTAGVEDHGGVGADYIKSIVFGGLDGIVTEFALGRAGNLTIYPTVPACISNCIP